jgi:hypothetical protein
MWNGYKQQPQEQRRHPREEGNGTELVCGVTVHTTKCTFAVDHDKVTLIAAIAACHRNGGSLSFFVDNNISMSSIHLPEVTGSSSCVVRAHSGPATVKRHTGGVCYHSLAGTLHDLQPRRRRGRRKRWWRWRRTIRGIVFCGIIILAVDDIVTTSLKFAQRHAGRRRRCSVVVVHSIATTVVVVVAGLLLTLLLVAVAAVGLVRHVGVREDVDPQVDLLVPEQPVLVLLRRPFHLGTPVEAIHDRFHEEVSCKQQLECRDETLLPHGAAVVGIAAGRRRRRRRRLGVVVDGKRRPQAGLENPQYGGDETPHEVLRRGHPWIAGAHDFHHPHVVHAQVDGIHHARGVDDHPTQRGPFRTGLSKSSGRSVQAGPTASVNGVIMIRVVVFLDTEDGVAVAVATHVATQTGGIATGTAVAVRSRHWLCPFVGRSVQWHGNVRGGDSCQFHADVVLPEG